MSRYLPLLLVITALFGGCDPYRFGVKSYEGIDCRIFSDPHLVHPFAQGFKMDGGAVVGMQILDRTQYYCEMYLKQSNGDGFQVLLRPIVEESVIDSGLILSFSRSRGMTLDSSGKMILQRSAVRFPSDSMVFVTIYNEEKFLQVTVGCDTVVKYHGSHMASDDIVFKTLGTTDLTILKPEWYKIKFSEGDDIYIVSEEKRR